MSKVSTLVLSHDGIDPYSARVTLLGPDTLVLASVKLDLAAIKQAIDNLAAGNDQAFRLDAVGQCANGV